MKIIITKEQLPTKLLIIMSTIAVLFILVGIQIQNSFLIGTGLGLTMVSLLGWYKLVKIQEAGLTAFEDIAADQREMIADLRTKVASESNRADTCESSHFAALRAVINMKERDIITEDQYQELMRIISWGEHPE